MESIFRIFDFNVLNEKEETSDNEEGYVNKDTAKFLIQMFGINEKGETCSIIAENFKPFFYVKVDESWNQEKKVGFLAFIKKKIGKYYQDSIVDCKLIKKKKLYGFDGGKEHKFIFISFENVQVFNKTKNIWYDKNRKLLENGLIWGDTQTYLYEANIPPLLRFFHIKDISPSGWVALPKKKTIEIKMDKKTSCTYEFMIDYKSILALNENETRVPYKICSFDIEASSSHGDFPIPVKSYKKLATNIVEHFEKNIDSYTPDLCKEKLREIMLCAFGYKNTIHTIDIVYPKNSPSGEQEVKDKTELWLTTLVRSMKKEGDDLDGQMNIEEMFESMNQEEEMEAEAGGEEGQIYYGYKNYKKKVKQQVNGTVVDILCDKKYDRDTKLNEINISLNKIFPKLEGDKVTFIGSTFLKYGEQEPYLNHCIALNTCSPLPVENSQLESYNTEEKVLLAWKELVQRENPDIIIGYNIFGFDYEFMFRRAEENGCVKEFLKLSRNNNEVCANLDRDTQRYKLEETSIQIASGQHDLKYIKMNGRIQIDLYNFFRREENLTSYKLDYVSGHFIGDYVKQLDYDEDSNKTTIKTGNMTGLLEGSYIHLEEIGHSTDYYADGAKFNVVSVDKNSGKFTILGNLKPDFSKKVRWCLAKDDVTPKDIFELTNGTADDRAVIAKYCIQDCNLVHYLMNKVDVLTGFIEMSKICSVPISFLVLRGQGIKLTSYVAKKCREKGTLMPVLEKLDSDDGYEGAIVLDPKCDLYLDNPVACVDYASLYPSSMMSENLSHDSKVWTKEYNLNNELLTITGETDETGEIFIYDGLPDYEYVDICYDTFKYVRKSPTSAAEKIKSGYKICRFAQFPEGSRAIMPSILEELLLARKTTRKLIPQQTDEFMKNVLDKRQLGYKVTANSLYGQCGARTSTFYEKDIAASTTATGRKLLTYAKRIIEETYGDAVCETTKYGPVLTKAEYIYGDSVASETPIYVRINGQLDICTIEQVAYKYGNSNWVKCSEPGKQEKEFCELEEVETWSDKGWTKLHRVIRHELTSHKKMIRILTHTGLVDVTDDHSLIKNSGEEISPKDCEIGTELLHNLPPMVQDNIDDIITEEEAEIMGFFFGDGSCGSYECPSGKKSSWALNNASTEIIEKYMKLCKIVYSDFEWVAMPTLESSGVYKISPRTSKYGSISKFVNSYREKLYYKNSKIVPQEVLNGSLRIRNAFMNGLYDADGDKDIKGYTRIDQKNQISSSHINWLARSIGWNTSINTRSDKPNVYRTTMTHNSQRKNPIKIKKIHEMPYEGYVYDLTTDNHHFAAGIGNLIVHNTDSVFFTFNLHTPEGEPIKGKKALEITIELAKEAGHLASQFLKNPHDLEYEKTFMPFCLLSKKRYVGMLYEDDPDKCKRKEMGIVLKRRDNAPIVKDVYGGIIDILMKEQDIGKATEFLRTCLRNIVNESYPIEKLVITKSLRSGYKNPQQIAHKVLADRMTARDPGNKPSSGDRIPFVYVHNPNKKALQGDKIETPTYIKEANLKIDYSHYITNQIMKPVQQVFALVLEKMWKMQGLIGDRKINKFNKDVQTLKKSTPEDKFEDKLEKLRNTEVNALLFDEFLRETNNKKQGQRPISFSLLKK
jgi:DNA polymerase elongation subunit (family B)